MACFFLDPFVKIQSITPGIVLKPHTPSLVNYSINQTSPLPPCHSFYNLVQSLHLGHHPTLVLLHFFGLPIGLQR
uniref:Uncharacterized protein n=1 Tax=Cucumis sativus TaxID=3659 RepID=A0A0A0LM29_CUCSA